jgi:hypothetical protein
MQLPQPTSILLALGALSSTTMAVAMPAANPDRYSFSLDVGPDRLPKGHSSGVTASCGPINGNCYENGCNGYTGKGSWTCTTGPYKDCPCGYHCGFVNGPCSGCGGINGRCFGDTYYGCSCDED